MSERALLSTRKGLFELHRSGGGWAHRARPLPRRAGVDRAGRPRATAACMRRSTWATSASSCTARTPAATAWTEIAAPAYPPKPDDSTDTVEWKNKLIWALETGGADEPGVLWAGTLAGRAVQVERPRRSRGS